jgi:hypothetical protein
MSQAPERVQKAIRTLSDDAPGGRRYSLAASGSGRNDGTGSFRASLIKRACEDAGHTLESPGEIEQYYFADRDVIAIDLNPED